MELRRAVKVSLAAIGVRDRRRLAALYEAYRGAVNFFIRLLWREPGAGFTTATSKRLARTRLSGRYRDQALKQALEIVSSTRKSGKALGVTPRRPRFRGQAILDAKFVDVLLGQVPERPFDLTIRISSLRKGARLRLWSKQTRMLHRWLGQPGATVVQGCGLSPDLDLLTLWVKFPAPEKRTEGDVLGVDVGVSKLLATSEGQFLGTSFRSARDRVRRTRPGSRGRRRARRARDQLTCAMVRRLPWHRLRAIVFEDLTRIKFGKKRGRGRGLRRALAAWRPPLVAQRLVCLAQEHGVYDVLVPPWRNSTTCPRCQHCCRENRDGEAFCCRSCGHTDDADTVGAIIDGSRGLRRAARGRRHADSSLQWRGPALPPGPPAGRGRLDLHSVRPASRVGAATRVSAQRHGEQLLSRRVEDWEREWLKATEQREDRLARARRRGEAQAQKRRLSKAVREVPPANS